MRSCSMSLIESLFRPCADYATHRQAQHKKDASERHTMFLTLWTARKVE